ncbi:DUF4184 family protein [Kitasatospora gansuensis]
MPFTFSHPAAILPLLSQGRGRGRLIASGLVAGSLVPDLPYFLASLAPELYGFGEQTHSWWGVPTLDVLLAALLVLLWHGLLRAPLVALLPVRWAWAADRLTAAQRPRSELPRETGWLLLSCAIGAATHVGWDAFTHHDRAGCGCCRSWRSGGWRVSRCSRCCSTAPRPSRWPGSAGTWCANCG